MTKIADLLKTAIARREKLICRLHAENTDTYRVLHGVNEGLPGVTVDRYGAQLLVQSSRQPLDTQAVDLVCDTVNAELGLECFAVYHDRQNKTYLGPPEPGEDLSCHELGVSYAVRNFHRGNDPLLFLDLRAARRYLLTGCSSISVLNTFAYTCGAGICAAVAGASEVWNIDFAASSLDFGRINARMNGVADRTQFVQEDFFPAVRQLAGLPIKGRGARRPYRKLGPKGFDLVFMDPPRWAKSSFGTVDVVRDYQSLFKPALLAVNPRGRIICTNHVPGVDQQEWLELLRRCSDKAGRPATVVDIIVPEEDFPSPDGRHPLKIAVLDLD